MLLETILWDLLFTKRLIIAESASGTWANHHSNSEKSEVGVEIEFIDNTDTFKGWKLVFTEPDSKVRDNSVEFGQERPEIV